jgi:hypothetical protein
MWRENGKEWVYRIGKGWHWKGINERKFWRRPRRKLGCKAKDIHTHTHTHTHTERERERERERNPPTERKTISSPT